MTNSQTSEGRAPGERRPAARLKNTGGQRLLFSGSVVGGSLATAQPAPWTGLIADINKDEQQLVIFLPLRKIEANDPTNQRRHYALMMSFGASVCSRACLSHLLQCFSHYYCYCIKHLRKLIYLMFNLTLNLVYVLPHII